MASSVPIVCLMIEKGKYKYVGLRWNRQLTAENINILKKTVPLQLYHHIRARISLGLSPALRNVETTTNRTEVSWVKSKMAQQPQWARVFSLTSLHNHN